MCLEKFNKFYEEQFIIHALINVGMECECTG